MNLRTLFVGTGILVVSLIPVAPYLAPVPNPGHWTIILKNIAAVSPQNAAVAPVPWDSDEPRTVDVIQAAGISRVTLNFQGAPPVQIDRKGDYYIRRASTGAQLFGTGNGPLSFFALDDGFLFAEWVRQEGASAFKKVVQYKGVTCFYYQNEKPEMEKDPNNGQEAWIDVHTMLPVAAKDDGIEADYQFQAPPDSPPPLSVEEAHLVQARENALKAQSSIR
jgi:hypothetical protein